MTLIPFHLDTSISVDATICLVKIVFVIFLFLFSRLNRRRECSNEPLLHLRGFSFADELEELLNFPVLHDFVICFDSLSLSL